MVKEPSPVPSRIAQKACQKDSPMIPVASTPRNTVANSRFGESQVHRRLTGRPCRSCSGTNSAPPGSTAMTLVP
jgi:hypothetical protein